MSKTGSSIALALSVAATSVTITHAKPAAAAPPTKDECVEAHSRGQDLREKGQLARSRAMFMVCANAACPSLVQADCAHFADDLERLVPSVTFGARDDKGADIPTTQVYVDDAQVASRLDDGKAYELDPGKHTIRFVHDGKEVTLKVVVSQGEKARPLVASFGDPNGARGRTDGAAGSGSASGAGAGGRGAGPGGDGTTPYVLNAHHRPIFPLLVAGVGAAALGTGIALTLVGLGEVPAACDLSGRQCAAAPGSSAFDNAKSAVQLANLGVGTAVAGGLVTLGSLVWYFMQPADSQATMGTTVAPWIDAHGGGGLGAAKSF